MQACRVPPASQETLLCMTRTLLNSTLGLEGLFEAAAAERDPSAANAWLQTHLDGCLMRSAAMLSRTVAEQYRSIAPACQQVGACMHYQHGIMQSFYHISPDGDYKTISWPCKRC